MALQAECGGVVYFKGDDEVLERGVCWNTSGLPEISDFKTVDGAGEGNFTSTLTGLYTNTKYYVRAYATSAVGTAYGSEMVFTTQQFDANYMMDIDGNVYKTIKIGTQEWMAENLKVTHYRDGTPISFISNNSSWSSATLVGAYCFVNGNSGSSTTFGNLYNINAAINASGIAPPGWHMPSYSEWAQLINYLGGNTIAGAKMKSIGSTLWFGNVGATNESGFTALPAGSRAYFNGNYYDLQYKSTFWSKTGSSSGYYCTYLWNNTSAADQALFANQSGFSIRLVKD